MASGFAKEQNLERQIEKQMGCMAGFLHIFDRNHILTGKRLYSAKRLPSSSVADTTSGNGKSAPPSPVVSGDLGKPQKTPEAELRSLAVIELPPKSPLPPLPLSDSKQSVRSPWKFSKEAPRLSLDSRATTDSKGGLHPKSVANGGHNLVDDAKDDGLQRRFPSVIAKLMGLELLPNSSGFETEKTPELRRSASESRVSKDLFQSRFSSDGVNFNARQLIQSHPPHVNSAVKDNPTINSHYADPRNNSLKKSVNGDVHSTTPWRAPQPRKSFFDSGDIFPETKQSATVYGEIEKRIKMRGLDEPSKDLETLKLILEALQLKGLLHSKPSSPQNQLRHRTFVYDEPPIVLMKPSRSSASTPINRRTGNPKDYTSQNARNHARGVRRSYNLTGETSPSPSPRRDRSLRSPTRSGRSTSPTTRSIESRVNPTRSNSPVKSKPLNMEAHRRANESPQPENRKSSPIRSPKLTTRKTGADWSPKSKRATSEIQTKQKITTIVIAEDEYSSISGSSITTSTDTERSNAEEYKSGKNLLERCDKLLHSIAEMGATDMQPSPVSVLDSSFYKDESLTPSPVTTTRKFGYKDECGELEDEIWSPVMSPIRSKCLETPDDRDFLYVSDILRASHHLPEDDPDSFLVLEKQQYLNGCDTSHVSRVQRKLIYDTVNEIVSRSKCSPPWKVSATIPHLHKVWSEFQRIQERDGGEDLFETVCIVLKKDLARDATTGWGECPVEASEMVLDIERMVFKDMISEVIEDLISSMASSFMMARRKLVF